MSNRLRKSLGTLIIATLLLSACGGEGGNATPTIPIGGGGLTPSPGGGQGTTDATNTPAAGGGMEATPGGGMEGTPGGAMVGK